MTVYLARQLPSKFGAIAPTRYYALVDILSGSALRERRSRTGGTYYPRREITLDPSKPITLLLDIKELGWLVENDTSAVIPSAGPFSRVPEGKYLLYVEVDGGDGQIARSGKTEVSIAYTEPPAEP